jgi:hypothetical protein
VKTTSEKKSNLGDSLLLASNETKERAKHATECKKSTSKCDTRFGLGLESSNGINPSKCDEHEGLVSKEFNWVRGEREFILFLLILRERSLVCSLLERVLDIESFCSKGCSIFKRVTDIDVAKEDVLGHSPQFNTNSTLLTWVSRGKLEGYPTHDLIKALCRGKVLKVVGVGDSPGCPLALVGWVVNQGSKPFALVKRVRLVRTAKRVLGLVIVAAKGTYLPLPLAAARSLIALGIGNSRSDPVTIFIIIPLLRLLSVWIGGVSRRQTQHTGKSHTRIRDSGGFIIKPTFRLLGLLIDDLIGLILIPVLGLLGIRVSDAFGVDPIRGLLVLGIIDFGRRVNRGCEILEKVTMIDAFTVNPDVVGIIRAERISVQVYGHMTIKLTVQRVCKD